MYIDIYIFVGSFVYAYKCTYKYSYHICIIHLLLSGGSTPRILMITTTPVDVSVMTCYERRIPRAMCWKAIAFKHYSPPQIDRIWGRGDLIIIYPKPYSIYLRGIIFRSMKICPIQVVLRRPWRRLWGGFGHGSLRTPCAFKAGDTVTQKSNSHGWPKSCQLGGFGFNRVPKG